MTEDQQQLLSRRRAGFDQWLAERLPVLRDFAAALARLSQLRRLAWVF